MNYLHRPPKCTKNAKNVNVKFQKCSESNAPSLGSLDRDYSSLLQTLLQSVTQRPVASFLDTVQKLQTRMLRCFGRKCSMGPYADKLPNIYLHVKVQGQRSRRWQRKRWEAVTRGNCRERNMNLDEAIQATQERRMNSLKYWGCQSVISQGHWRKRKRIFVWFENIRAESNSCWVLQ